MLELNKIHCGDSLQLLKQIDDKSIHCCVTSPPYFGLRNYGVDGQIGLENSLQKYITNLVNVFAEVHRVLRDDGTFWLNIGDSYNSNQAGKNSGGFQGKRKLEDRYGEKERLPGTGKSKTTELKSKELMGVPWRLAFALQNFGWYLRRDIIWAKGVSFNDKFSGSCMPESTKDRPTTSHEYLFLLTKSPKYFYDYVGVQEDGVWPAGTKAAKGSGDREGNRRGDDYAIYSGKRNLRSVWTIQTKPYKKAHFATFPEKLVEPCIKAGTKENGIVLDPFAGSGTTCAVAKKLNRNYLGLELNPDYVKLAEERIGEILL